jgi:hypothetical protein
MRRDVNRRGRAGIAVRVAGAGARLDVHERVVRLRGAAVGEPEFGGGVAEGGQDEGREARDWVVDVRHAGRDAGLVGDEGRPGVVSGARLAVGVDVGGVAEYAKLGACDGCNGSAEGVAGNDEGVGRMGSLCGLDGGNDVGLDFEPGGEEALVYFAAGARVGGSDQPDG